jgi:hypothetical protein
MKRRRADGGCGDARGSKQARRTGMAGPLGEMFDHGASWPSRLESDVLAHLHSRMRCPQYHSECAVAEGSSLFACVDTDLARGHPRMLRTESRSVVVDHYRANWHARQFLSNYLGGVSHWLVTFFSRSARSDVQIKANYTLEFFLVP